MPEDFDPKKFLRETEPSAQFDPKEYLRTNPDPNRGVLDKAGEAASGFSKGVIGDMLGVTHFLPGDELPFLPESARQARRGARAEVQKSVDQPDVSGYESGGRFVGKELPGFLLPGGGRLAAAGAAGVTRAVPTIAQLIAFYHNPLAVLVGHHLLQRAGMMGRLQSIANAAAPLAGKVAGAVTRVGERLGGAEAINAYGRDDPNAETTPAPTAPSSPAPDTPTVPGPSPAPGTARPVARSDAATDYPTPNRSGRGDRFPLYGSPTN